MLTQFRNRLARAIAPKYFKMLEEAADQANKRAHEAEFSANQRYAKMVADMDPLEPLFAKLSIVYSQEFTRPEEKLNEAGQIGFMMWAWQQRDDTYFNFLLDWITNSHGNETVKRAPITPERVMYGRAQISSMVLLKKEVGRLASLYEEKLEKMRGDDFDSSSSAD